MTQEQSANRECIGVVIVDHGSRKEESNRRLVDVVKWFEQATDYKIVEPAHLEILEPSIATAFSRCVERGATFVVVSPFMLLPGKHSTVDIPSEAIAAAEEHPTVKHVISEPLGINRQIVDVLRTQISQSLDDSNAD